MTGALEFRSATQKLRSLIEDSSILVLPGVADPWTARLAEQAGFEALFATGAGIANVSFGVPDIGLIGLAEMTEAVRRISRSIDVPLVVDGDTGYGNALNVYYAVEQYCRMGVAAITLEDQVTPKHCGHFDGKDLIPAAEMIEKIVAFTEAKGDSGTMLIARTDAIAVEGFDKAIARALSYVEAGADMIFLEAPSDGWQLASVPKLIPSLPSPTWSRAAGRRCAAWPISSRWTTPPSFTPTRRCGSLAPRCAQRSRRSGLTATPRR